MDLHGVQAEEEILAEPPRGDLRAHVGVGRRENTHVHAARARGTHPFELAFLQHAKELRLLRHREVRDLVEEERTAVREFEASDAVRLRVGECALGVAEELAFEYAFGKSAEVHGDHRARGARRGGVQPRGHDFLSGAVLARDQRVRVGRSDAFHEAQDGLHHRRFGDELRRAVAAEGEVLALEPLAAAQGAAEFHLGAQHVEQARVVERLLDVVARAAVQRLDRALDAAPRGHHDDGERGVELLEPREEVEPLGAARGVARVVHVHQQRVEIARTDGGGHARGRGDDLDVVPLALEQQAKGLEHVAIVVRHEKAGFWRGGTH